MRVAVFGAGGFIGRRLCRRLVAHGHAVKGFDRPGNAGRIVEGTLFVPGDFTTGEGVSQALEDCEAAVHLIWASVPATAFLATEFEVNVMPSLRLVEEATRRRIPVVFASSGGTVYGRARDLPIDEASPTEPINAYGAGKLAVETLMRVCAAQSGLDSRILRIANGFGRGVPYAGPQGAPDVFLTRALSGEAVELFGGGAAVRDHIYVEDIAEAIERAVLTAGPYTLNIGGGRGESILEVARAVERVSGRKLSIRYRPERRIDVPSSVLDVSRARKVLGFTARTGLEEGLACAWSELVAAAGGRVPRVCL